MGSKRLKTGIFFTTSEYKLFKKIILILVSLILCPDAGIFLTQAEDDVIYFTVYVVQLHFQPAPNSQVFLDICVVCHT